ncbi:ParB/RepB/Spo0J family partition protein [uncultured Tateyamaria sp.]|uniref:ParB/RepB/Spo0J family partition protein n=1 Tax=uncultured Tateyamaria sp. TaxID=455651 RepID=UPI0026366550|nr:ParB/RepB/Spo0J family partition protein [uncultured Tateyamaria sp.]
MTDQTHTIAYHPLDAITVSTMNPRQQDDHDPDQIDALAMSIAMVGLMQPLACYLPDTGAPEVVEGGRRLAALRLLRSKGSDIADAMEPDWDAIPCTVTRDQDQAQAWAGAAAASHVPLAPAQEIRAYAAMRELGKEPEQIASAFGVDPLRVKRRLKLADLAEPTLDALATGHITLDVARALTIAPNGAREVDVLNIAIEKRWGAHSVRQELEKNVVTGTDRRAIFVGLAAYEAAGGTHTPDLFGDKQILHDADLLDRLFKNKLIAHAETIRGDWMWSQAVFDHPWVSAGDTAEYDHVHRTPGDLSDADQDEYVRLSELANGDVLDEPGQATLADLQTRLDGDWTADEYATCGIFVFVDRDGQVRWDGAWRTRARTPTADPATSHDDTAHKVEAKATPQNAVEDFRRIELAAAQTALLGKHDLLLSLLAYQIETGLRNWQAPLNVSLSPPIIEPEKDTGLTLDGRLMPDTTDDRNAPSVEDFNAFVAKGPKHRNATLTNALARCLSSQTTSQFQKDLIATLNIDVRKIWTPDAANCFKRLPIETLDQMWGALVPTDKAEMLDPPFSSMNKGKKAAELEKLFGNAGYRETLGLSRAENAAIDAWVPAEMQGDA